MFVPNGSGKTNIVLFFEFLSHLISNNLTDSISKVGGVGAIFRKNETGYQPNITGNVYGSKKVRPGKWIFYEFMFNIVLSLEKDLIYYGKQSVRIKNTDRFISCPDKIMDKIEWDFEIRQETDEKTNKPSIYIDRINRKEFPIDIPVFVRRKRPTNEEDYKKLIQKYLEDYDLPSTSMLYLLSRFLRISPGATWRFAQAITNDFNGGETFNIIPSRVRQPEDSADAPGIQKDGRGLATTLYAMKKEKMISSKRNMFYHFPDRESVYSKKHLERVIENCKLANRSIKDIDIQNDPLNNQLVVRISIDSGDNIAELPLSAMSDGTIKWLALITAVLTSRDIFSIEEPENYLHPWMQGEIVKLMRSTFSDDNKKSFILMTTHSESLINYATPEELVRGINVNGEDASSKS